MHNLSKHLHTDINEKFKDYFKVLFVRDPFRKIVSAYKNKIEFPMDKPFYESYIKKLKKRNETVPKKIYFPQFINYTLDELRRKVGNEHWGPSAKLVPLCTLDFDAIGKFETLEQDAKLVLSHLFKWNFTLPITNRTPNRKDYTHYFKLLDNKTIKELLMYYADDFEAFGYDPNGFISK